MNQQNAESKLEQSAFELAQALKIIISDIKSKPNDTRYLKSMKVGQTALIHYDELRQSLTTPASNEVGNSLKLWEEVIGIAQRDHGEIPYKQTAKELNEAYGFIQRLPSKPHTVEEGQTQEPVGGMKEKCNHEWVGYKQCCYCGAMENSNGEVLAFTKHPQYPVKKLSEDFEEWYFSIKNDTGKPPLAMQIFYWFSKHLNLFEELIKTTPPPAPIKTEGEDESYSIVNEFLDALEEVIGRKAGMAEYFMQHNYRRLYEMYEIMYSRCMGIRQRYYEQKEYAPPSPVGIELVDIPKPIGDFIIEQKDITGTMGNDGMYYHYSQVCVLLNRLKPSLPQSSTEEYEEEDKLWSELIEDVEDCISQTTLQGKYKISKR